MKQVPRRRTRTVRSSAFLDLKHRARVARERHVRTFDSQNAHNFCYLERLLRVMFLIFVARGEVPLCQKKKSIPSRAKRERVHSFSDESPSFFALLRKIFTLFSGPSVGTFFSFLHLLHRVRDIRLPSPSSLSLSHS